MQTHGSCFQLTALRGCQTIEVYQFGKNIINKKQNSSFIFNMTSARYKRIHEPLEAIFTMFSLFSMRLACLTTPLKIWLLSRGLFVDLFELITLNPKHRPDSTHCLDIIWQCLSNWINPLCCLILPFLLYLNYNAYFQY